MISNITEKRPGFPSTGINYFWFLNDYCDDAAIDRQIAEFAESNCAAVCLHPRDGLLLPYGGSDWFEFVRRTVKKMAARGLEVWIYDEDPYPSGNAGGRLVLDHPEFIARKIVMHKANPVDIKEDGLWFFPAKGSLQLCGLFDQAQAELVCDLTGRAGVIRRSWNELKNWDSRWYYPATPLYICDRGMAHKPEYALRVGKIPAGQVLLAFTIEAETCERWNHYVDALNSQATAAFIECTHEKYRQYLGDMLGREVSAIFADEAKYHSHNPWTPGMFADFRKCYGYDLVPRLFDLFTDVRTENVMRTKLNYRDWCGKRFEQAWMQPVAEWCAANNLAMVGHLSPEEDPVSQTGSLSNLMPLQKYFSLAGTDLIIPAVGDSRHPLLNLSIVSTVSAAQQQRQPGVMSESLACSGYEFTDAGIRRILNWQTVMGMTTPVVHGAFLSLRGERKSECPPDYSPGSRFGAGLARLAQDLVPVQKLLIGAAQIAPVAVLWPIKSFHLLNKYWQAENGGLREELMELVHLCLAAQVGVQILDEADLLSADIEDGQGLRLGNARYTHLIVPGSDVWKAETWQLLERENGRTCKVYQYGTKPRYLEAAEAVRELGENRFAELNSRNLASELPRLLQVQGAAAADVRVTSWENAGQRFSLLLSLAQEENTVTVNGRELQLSDQNIELLQHSENR